MYLQIKNSDCAFIYISSKQYIAVNFYGRRIHNQFKLLKHIVNVPRIFHLLICNTFKKFQKAKCFLYKMLEEGHNICWCVLLAKRHSTGKQIETFDSQSTDKIVK